MCIGMANGGKTPECISGKIPIKYEDIPNLRLIGTLYNGSIRIPKIMRDMLNIQLTRL